MLRMLHILLPLVAAYCFWRWVELEHLPIILPQVTSALSIFVAAILVRLARGMPTLDWKSIPIESRARLTGDLLDVAREYAGLLLLLMILLVSIFIIGSGPGWICGLMPSISQLISGAVGFLAVLSIIRFGYVVWRDLDIVVLQKTVIDGMAEQETASKNSEIAKEKMEQMRRANLSGGSLPGVEPFESDVDRSR